MKFLSFCRLLVVTILSISLISCGEFLIKNIDDSQIATICYNKTPPHIKCAETVTSTFDQKGTLWTVWAFNNYLYLQSSTDQGQNFSPAQRINTTPESIKARGESRPKIKLDQQGNIYLTWTKSLGKRFTSDIRFSYSKDGGHTFSKPVTINDDQLKIGHSFDSLAIGQKGEIFITWLDGRDGFKAKQAGEDYTGSSLYYSYSTDQGNSFSANKKIAGQTCQCCRLQTAIDQNNQAVVVWRHIFAGGIRDHALLKFNDWENAGEVTRITHENWKIDACPHHGAGLSIAKDNRYHLVWFSNSATHQGLFYGFSTDSGKSFSKPFNFAQQGSAHPHTLTLDRQALIVWQEFDGSHTLAKLIRSNDRGETWDKPQVIAQVATDKMDQPFLINKDHQAYLSWHQPNQGYQLIALNKKLATTNSH